MATSKEKYTCEKCGRTIDSVNFYTSKNKEKYPPDGRMNICKKCLCMHVNSWEPTTFLNILKEIDIPYIEVEWNSLLEKYGRDPRKVSGTTIMGRYISKMKLKQWSSYGWADTETLAKNQLLSDKVKNAQLLAQKENRYAASLSSIDLQKYMDKSPDELTDEEIENLSEEELSLIYAQPNVKPPEESGFEDEDFEYSTIEVKQNRPEDLLTQEDRMYLSIKWGKLYRAEEWIALEKFYYDMINSFDIQGAAHINYLIMICKTQLKAQQAIDCGDVEGFQKLAKVYDSLMKSSKFTPLQNKNEDSEFVDSLGELIYIAEEKGFIPIYHEDEPKDIVDITLRDMKNYTYKLVTEEMGLGNMIEAALQQMQRQEESEGELDNDYLFGDPDTIKPLEDGDFEEYFDEIETQKENDKKLGGEL